MLAVGGRETGTRRRREISDGVCGSRARILAVPQGDTLL